MESGKCQALQAFSPNSKNSTGSGTGQSPLHMIGMQWLIKKHYSYFILFSLSVLHVFVAW